MNDMPEWYRQLPFLVHHPTLVQLGGFSFSWYALAYLVSLGGGVWILWWHLRRQGQVFSLEQWFDLALAIMAGVVIGGRLGFVFLYQPVWFAAHPGQMVWPFDPVSGVWTGIAGMSFHGGLMGVGLGLWWFARRYGISWWLLADGVALVAPLGSFLGRLANFVNGELYGRVTGSIWGMVFPADLGVLRFPSQLFEAVGEGVGLGLFLWWLSRRVPIGAGRLMAGYLVGYGVIRFGIEFVREPDRGVGLFLGNTLTMGQILCLFTAILGIFLWRNRAGSAILGKP